MIYEFPRFFIKQIRQFGRRPIHTWGTYGARIKAQLGQKTHLGHTWGRITSGTHRAHFGLPPNEII